MVFFNRYCAVDIADFIEEVQLQPSGSLFGLWNQRSKNTLICRVKPGKWYVLGRIKAIQSKPVAQHYLNAGLSLDFNPIILCKRK